MEGEGIPPHPSRAKRSPDSSGFLCFLCAPRVNLPPPLVCHRSARLTNFDLRRGRRFHPALICASVSCMILSGHDSVLGSLGSFDSRHSPLDSFSGVTLRSVTNTLRVTLRNSKSFGFTELVTIVSFFPPSASPPNLNRFRHVNLFLTQNGFHLFRSHPRSSEPQKIEVVLINRSRWRGERFWLDARRDAGRILAAG